MSNDNIRKFAPLTEEHHLVQEGDICPACKKPFKAGDVFTLISLGPGDDSEDREKARNGKTYDAVAIPVHWSCATGEGSHKITNSIEGKLNFQRCTNSKHLGMTFRCPRRKSGVKCIECLGCAAESDSETCGSYVYTINPDGTYERLREISDEEWGQLQEFPLPVHTLIVLLGQEKQRFNQVKALLKNE